MRVAEYPICIRWEEQKETTYSEALAVIDSVCDHRQITPIGAGWNGYGNALWNIIVTMTTVGFGDMYPISSWGRAVIVTVSIVAALTGEEISESLQRVV
jgi:hypothetical protein